MTAVNLGRSAATLAKTTLPQRHRIAGHRGAAR